MNGAPTSNDNPVSRQVIVAAPSRAEGVGRALKSAFRGRLDTAPPEFARLLEKLA